MFPQQSLRLPVRRTIVLLLLSVACGRSSSEPEADAPEGAVLAVINNIEFKVLSGVFVTYQRGVLAFAAKDETNRVLHITLIAPVKPMVVEIGAGGANSGITSNGLQTWRSNLAGGSGTVTFKQVTYNQSIGTFRFTAQADHGTPATGTMTVTGSFNITYTRE